MIHKKTVTVLSFILIIICTLPLTAGELTGDVITLESIKGEKDVNLVIAEGNVSMIDGENEIGGDYARYHTGKRDILFKGNIQMITNNYEIYGNEINGNLEDEFFTITGKAKIEGSELTLESQIIEYKQKKGIIIARKDPSLKYNQISATADLITFYRDKEEALLTGNVRGKRNGQEFRAEKLILDLENEKIDLQGQARITFPEKGEK